MKATLVLCLALFACSVTGESYDYQKYNYKLLTSLDSATTCTKAFVGNTPATCPVSAGVPLTAEGKDGSTVCVAAVDGKSYEAVFSLTYPAAGAVPGCTSNAQCSPDGSAKPGIVCGTNGPSGVSVPNTCWPLAPSACPFTGDTVVKGANQQTATPAAPPAVPVTPPTGPFDFVKYNYTLLTSLSNATNCTKVAVGNTPATCPLSAGVPLTADGKDGSTVCVTAVSGQAYEAVFSLTYPSAATPGCTSDAQCSPSGTALAGIVCGTSGPAGMGIPNTCFPLAPSGCPFTGDTVVKPTVTPTPVTASAGRKLFF
jgi:hypothetical protein